MIHKLLLLVAITMLLILPSDHAQAQTAKRTAVKCGEELQGEFTADYQAYYYGLTMEAKDQFQVVAQAIGGQMKFVVLMFTPPPANRIFARAGQRYFNIAVYPHDDMSVKSGVLSAKGEYTVVVYNGTASYGGDLVKSRPGGAGLYTLAIGCTLADGTQIAPGSKPKQPEPDKPDSTSNQPAAAPFSGFGFPGVNSVDFSKANEIVLAKGQTQNGALGSSGADVFTYVYPAKANSTAKLTITRMSGNLAIGVAVVNKADKSIIFIAGMPSSGSLIADLSFPKDGTYVVGIFRLDIPSTRQVGTSGTYSIKIE